MTTRCPHCGTVFKVVPDQLRVRDGLVRCGECSTVFDGRACLVAHIPQGVDQGRVPPEPPVPDTPAAPAVLRGRAMISAGRSGSDDGHDDDLDLDDEPIALSGATNSADRSMADEDPPRFYSDPHPHRASPAFLDADRQAHRSFMRRLWGYACLVGLVVLAAQLTFVYRAVIADMVPELRPVLDRLCKPIKCEVGYVRHIDKILITASTLQPPVGQASASEQGASRTLILRATLRNTYSKPQPWPALRLDLRDLSDTVVIRKVLLPESYLPKTVIQKPFGAGAEVHVEIPINVDGVGVNGFDLHKFFP